MYNFKIKLYNFKKIKMYSFGKIKLYNYTKKCTVFGLEMYSFEGNVQF